MDQSNNTMEQKQTNTKSETKTTSSKTMNGTEQTSAWEKATENIAGDNQLMASLLKLLLSPFALLAGVGLIVYLFFKNQQLKKEIEKLKEENKKLADDNSENSERADHYHKKYKKMKQVFEIDQNQGDNYPLPENTHTSIHNVNKNKNSLLR